MRLKQLSVVYILEAVVNCQLHIFFQYALVKFGICVGLVLCGYREQLVYIREKVRIVL